MSPLPQSFLAWQFIQSCGFRYLEIPKGKLAGILEKYRGDSQKCLVEMLETWLERVDPPATWAAIIDAVEFLGEEQLGKELRKSTQRINY